MREAPAPLIYVAGHRGMVGSAIVRALTNRGHPQDRILVCGHDELDLKNQQAVNDFFAQHRPDQVVLAAAKVGGIIANNTLVADFIYDNLMIEANVIHAAHVHGVKRLLFLGSSCIYPRDAEQPMAESALLSGKLEPTNEPYAIAKIAGIKLCESYNRQHGCDFRAVMPTNLYGPNDNYHPEHSHVIPGLIRRFHEATQADAASVAVWGTGRVRREFLYVDDMAQACLHVLDLAKEIYQSATSPQQCHINIGFGSDITIAELARLVADTVGFKGAITFDVSKPDGAPQKLMDSTLANSLGWQPRIHLEQGLKLAYQDFKAHDQEQRS